MSFKNLVINRTFLGCLSYPCLLLVLCNLGCTLYDKPRQFDPDIWRSGNAIERGRMIEDLNATGVLTGRSKAGVKQLLGKPEVEKDTWFGYEVNTVSECYFWTCRAEFGFDPLTGTVNTKIVVSD